jgi:hypothetical protein
MPKKVATCTSMTASSCRMHALGLEGFAAYHLQLVAFFELRDAGLHKIEALVGNKPPQLSVTGSIEAAVVIDRGGQWRVAGGRRLRKWIEGARIVWHEFDPSEGLGRFEFLSLSTWAAATTAAHFLSAQRAFLEPVCPLPAFGWIGVADGTADHHAALLTESSLPTKTVWPSG